MDPIFPKHEKTLLIRPEHLNHFNNLFGGFMMKWADEMAYNAATLSFPKGKFVTKLFEPFNFIAPVHLGDIIKIYCQIINVGNSSCRIKVWATNETQQRDVFETYAVMVHLENNRPTTIPR